MSPMWLYPLAPALLLIAACSSQAPPSSKQGSTLHVVQDQRLRELMAEMDSLVLSEKEMTEQQRDTRLRGYAVQMAQAAKALCGTVDIIVASLPRLRLSQTEQVTFLALADRLRGESSKIGELAGNNLNDGIPPVLEQMAVTCKACHQLFRPSGADGH